MLGCEYLYSLGPYRHDDTDWMTEHLGVDARAVMQRLHFYRCGGQAIFEVFQYAAPEQADAPPRNSDVGGHHVALYVDDLDAALAHLHAHDVDVMAEPTSSTGPSEGQRWIYFRAPWGMQFELVSYPGGKAFDRAGGTAFATIRRWHRCLNATSFVPMSAGPTSSSPTPTGTLPIRNCCSRCSRN